MAGKILPAKMDGSDSGGSSLPDLAGNAGKVLTVNAGADATEWAAGPAPAAAGADTQVLFNDGGAIAGDAGLTFDKTGNKLTVTGGILDSALTSGRAVIAKASGELGDNAATMIDPTTGVVTLGPPATDVTMLTARASAGPGTAHIAQFQASDNSPLSHIAHDGKFVGNVTGNVSGSSGSTTGNAATSSDGLSSASGTAPLTLTLAAKGLTGSVAAMTAASAGSGGAAGLVPASSAGDQAKFLRADATWQTAAGGGGVTNSAGANVITKSDGTNIVATALSEASAGAIATSAGTALSVTATAPAATTGASQAGVGVGLTASPAVASTDTAGAAAGGNVTVTAGAAARNTSGNANGGDVVLTGGAGIGTGTAGVVYTPGVFRVGSNATTGIEITPGTTTTISHGNSGSVLNILSLLYVSKANGYLSIGHATDNVVRRKGAANPAWGPAAASPVAYTHTLAADSRAGTDTDVRGAKATLTPGIGTGTGGSGDLAVQTAPPRSTGTAANTPADRIVLASKPVTLTESSATPILDYAVASGTVAGGTVWYTIRADNGTDFQALRGQVQWSAVNKGGTLTASIGLVGTEVSAVSAGTLTNTPTITTGTNSISINLNAVSSLTQTTLYAFVSAQLDGTGVATTK